MKQIRIEVRISVVVHAGDDISEQTDPTRDPDAVVATKLVRIAHCGPMVHPREVASAHMTLMVANALPVLAEQVRHALREKGL